MIVANLGVHAAAARLVAELQRRGLADIDVLVNNAGFGDFAPFDSAEPTKLAEMIQLNVATLTELTRFFLPGMVARRHGWILLVGAVAGFAPGPGAAVYPSAEAQDLTQGFFASLLEHNSLGRATREKGRLRTFLLGSLQHFLANEYDRAQTLKRGGGKQIVSLDEHLVEAEAAVSAGGDSDADGGYDQAWAVTLARRAWERLHAAFIEEGKGDLLMELKPLVAGGSTTVPDQSEVAARLGLPIFTLRTRSASPPSSRKTATPTRKAWAMRGHRSNATGAILLRRTVKPCSAL